LASAADAIDVEAKLVCAHARIIDVQSSAAYVKDSWEGLPSRGISSERSTLVSKRYGA
jgi:hypothetical protein